MLIGLGEAVITTLVIVAILRTRPDLVEPTDAPPDLSITRLFAACGLAAIVGLLLFAVPFASSRPDGLERVAEALGFGPATGARALPAPLADYRLPGLGSATAATSAAGFVGTLVAFALAYALAAALTPKAAAGPPDRGA